MLNETRTLSFLCPDCGQTVIVTRDLFALAAQSTKIPCPCGKSTLTVHLQPEKTELEIPCHICKKTHYATCPSSAFVGEKLLTFSCSALACCYIGQEGAVFQNTPRLEQEADLWAGKDPDSAILNPLVMEEVVSEIKEIAQRGGISCACGAVQWDFKIDYTSVTLLCESCGATSRIPASITEDIDNICCCYTLVIGGKEGEKV